jgi:hypothetical protein
VTTQEKRPASSAGAGFRTKLGPIPDSHFENDMPMRDPAKEMTAESLAAFDRKTEEIRAAAMKLLKY